MPKNAHKQNKHLPPSTMTDLKRTTISRYIFSPQIAWCSHEQPKSGLRIPKTATETPTAVSPMSLCFCVVWSLEFGVWSRFGARMARKTAIFCGVSRFYHPAFLAINDFLAKQFSTLFRVNTGLRGCVYSILNRVKLYLLQIGRRFWESRELCNLRQKESNNTEFKGSQKVKFGRKVCTHSKNG